MHLLDMNFVSCFDDVEATLNHSDWKNRTRPEEGVKVLDLTRDLDTDPKERVL
jgi:hypothetical protein